MSTLILYKNSKIIPTENYIVDSIEDYLSSLTKEEITNFQYIKHSFGLNIKISMNQSTLNFFNFSNNINYVSIKNFGDNYPSYYFVIKKSWISETTISLMLQMDTINTFTTARNSFTISDRTLIHRQHKDRFVKYISPIRYYRNIDLYSEGITPKLYKNEDKIINDTLDVDWYLIYKNTEENPEDASNVVNCFLVSSNILNVEYYDNEFIETSNIGNNYYYLAVNSGNKILYYINGNQKRFINITSNEILKIGKIGEVLTIALYDINKRAYSSILTQKITMDDGESIKYSSQNLDISQSNAKEIIAGYTSKVFSNTLHNGTIKDFANVNKTDSKIIKIIKLPYLPTEGFSYNDNKLFFDSNIWSHDSSELMLKLKDVQNDFLYKIEVNDSLVKKAFDLTEVIPQNPSLLNLKSISRESKLFHSDYYQFKIYYDSFSKDFKNEYLYETTIEDFDGYEFKPSRTINSRFIFKFGRHGDEINHFKYKDEDYQKYLSIERNNDEVLYNSPYINYIRSGFNYDVKSKNRQEAFSWFTSIMGLIGGGLSVAFGSKTLGAGLIASSILSIGSAINTTIQAENNLNSKLETLRWQTNSVSNSDAVDLMTYYSKNRLHEAIYKVSPKMQEVLFDLFYYTGYIEERQGLPNFLSRKWFNFVSCDLIFNEIRNIPDECLEDLISRYKGGITQMHMNVIDNVKMWNWNRNLENWENIFFN